MIMFQYNAQHNCRCPASGQRAVLQEQVELHKAFIEHKPLDHFLINIHAFHNAHLIRAVLPRELTAPIAYSADRRGDHFSIATKLRDVQDGKREKTAEKKKANAELKKAAEAEGGTASETAGKKSAGCVLYTRICNLCLTSDKSTCSSSGNQNITRTAD